MTGRLVAVASLVAGVLLAAGCGRPGGPDAFLTQTEFPGPDAGVPPTVAALTCAPAKSSIYVPPRSTVIGQAQSTSATNTYATADLFDLFNHVCGSCHSGEGAQGGFNVPNAAAFPSTVTVEAYNLMTTTDPTMVMPPYMTLLSEEPASSAVVQLASYLKDWLDQGSPAGQFILPGTGQIASTGYTMSATLGAQLTNIGSCIPPKAMVGTNASAMTDLDAMFAQATQLPPTLDQTDLNTLDSAVLAQSGVISYAPTYPLWSDDAQKMRYVRVPQGQSIVFDKAAQKFSIPANTRFYKTFLKEVVDVNGNQTYKKIETRLIVSRPDTMNPDGSAQQNALYGTYVWNEDESQANLLNVTLRDNEGFADKIFEYVTDEKKAAPIIASNPSNLLRAEENAGVTRHYAVPGSLRCVQCHEGSPSESFVLGFTPLQIARRPTGEGGTYEAAAGDELTQLQRLIDYGVITGISSPGDILPLERSEGSRAPRNVYELNAQAYMVGNCAHCHNPRGYPSIRQPAVKDLLVFLPGSGANEGIFQFPLDTMSPLRQRGELQNIPIPYITPSLYDTPNNTSTPKYFCPGNADDDGNCVDAPYPAAWVLAPWRSLIYRNTDTAFDYFDDYALFPHMPLNTSGYDCRVAKLMGDWMVSIPAKLKNPKATENIFPVYNVTPPIYAPSTDTDAQPYQEVLPTDPGYGTALAASQARLASYHSSYRYNFCPSFYTADIIDPFIQSEVDQGVPVTSDIVSLPDPNDASLIEMPALTPLRPDYIAFDNTDPPPPWAPRRAADWPTALVNPNITSYLAAEQLNGNTTDPEDLANVVTALESVTLTDDVRTALTTKVPFGLYAAQPGCTFSGVPTASSFTGANQPDWMTVAPPPANAPVLVESPGAAVFTTVCYNCHGLRADAQGLLADEISTLTGGDARVANLRDGLLGPVTSPGANRTPVFGPSATTLGITTDDLTARYMAWMTLGGTEKHLPQDILNEVAVSPVFGLVRDHIIQIGSPNMLQLGLTLCEQILGIDAYVNQVPLNYLFDSGRIGWSNFSGLIEATGDADMWLKLCSLGNRPVVRVLLPISSNPAWTVDDLDAFPGNLYWATDPTNQTDFYGANPVMDQNGNVQTGIDGSKNFFPLCMQKPADAASLQYATQTLQARPVSTTGATLPFCPDSLFNPSNQNQLAQAGSNPTDWIDGRKWAARGAINAALAVFLYLNGVESDPTQAQVPYNQCPTSSN
ncbi:MAG TPA: hypothetical protein VHG72_18030 [Polyangia bacterium]|nr:hypothetical protein [Polyangia bacterium]